MKKLFAITLCALMASTMTLSAQIFGTKKVVASKNYVTKRMHIADFNAVRVGGSFDVNYTQRAGRPEIVISTSDNIVDLLDIRVEADVLRINFKKNINVSYKVLTVDVYGPDVNNLSLGGSGKLTIKGGLKTEQALTLSLAGSGDFTGSDIRCADLKTSVAGSGDLSLSGVTCLALKASVAGSGDMAFKGIKATNVDVSIAGSGDVALDGASQAGKFSIAGSGDISAATLQVKDLDTSISGSGGIRCWAVDNLKIRVSGSGRVGYKGSPTLDTVQKGIYKLKD